MGSGVQSTTCNNGWACSHINDWMLLPPRANGEQDGAGERCLGVVATYGRPALKLGMLKQVEPSKRSNQSDRL